MTETERSRVPGAAAQGRSDGLPRSAGCSPSVSLSATRLDPFLALTALADYSGLSVRKLRDYLEDPPTRCPATASAASSWSGAASSMRGSRAIGRSAGPTSTRSSPMSSARCSLAHDSSSPSGGSLCIPSVHSHDPDPAKRLGEQIKHLREQRGLSQNSPRGGGRLEPRVHREARGRRARLAVDAGARAHRESAGRQGPGHAGEVNRPTKGRTSDGCEGPGTRTGDGGCHRPQGPPARQKVREQEGRPARGRQDRRRAPARSNGRPGCRQAGAGDVRSRSTRSTGWRRSAQFGSAPPRSSSTRCGCVCGCSRRWDRCR